MAFNSVHCLVVVPSISRNASVLILQRSFASVGTPAQVMMAFGLRGRTVPRLWMMETVLLGVLGIALGVALAYLVLRWMTLSQLSNTLPEIGLVMDLPRDTIVRAAALGIIALTVAPLLTANRPSHGCAPQPHGRAMSGSIGPRQDSPPSPSTAL